MNWDWKPLIFIAMIAYGGWQYFSHKPIAIKTPGVLVASEPLQTAVGSAPSLTLDHYRVEPLAAYSIEARVLGTKDYQIGQGADISPLDFAVGWGAMSDSAVLEHISISQGNRFYYWHVNEFPIPRGEIESHSANMHLIPANSTVERALKNVRPGNLVRLRGWLVVVSDNTGWQWRSSLSRTDTGNGACELMWVETVETGTVN
ncbi:MAG: hypothetical protein LBV44_05015 [Methylobacillus sp.]|jgi:hypothetical protein|nr:hypothetical protein [Methylobacillus sp.]